MKFSKIALYAFIALLLTRAIYYSISDGFARNRIEFPPIEHTPSNAPDPEQLKLLSSIFSEPFYYLAKGSQSYAFQNKDKSLILKLFKCHHWNDGSWAEDLPVPNLAQKWLNSLVVRRQKRVANTRNSFQIVHESLMAECGVLYMQETPSTSYDLQITIIDGAKREHILHASQISFTVQQKGKLIFPTLAEWLANGQIEEAKQGISSLVALIYRRCQKGIYDLDPDIHKNAGFIGTKAIFIDIGGFQTRESLINRDETLWEIKRCLKQLGTWIEQHAPNLNDFYIQALNNPEECAWEGNT